MVEKLDRRQELPRAARLGHSERAERNMMMQSCYKKIMGSIGGIQPGRIKLAGIEVFERSIRLGS
jgi:hypothetical protein